MSEETRSSQTEPRKQRLDWRRLEVVHRDAAGIDVGNAEHYVAIAADRDEEPVRKFGCFTEDLRRMADWLVERGIRTVAMQSTGVYWLPLYDVLEERGLQVFLVNASHTKNLPGRKSDVQECQWVLKLHTFGLLSNSFHPTEEIRVLRTYWRYRDGQVKEASCCIQRMQKTLTQMNLQLANAISDISGLTGMRILKAILAGERDGRKLAELADPRVKATQEQIARSLEGNWRKELLFVLEQEIGLYEIFQQRIAECDQQIQQHLESFPSHEQALERELGPRVKRKKKQGNAPAFDLRQALYRITGVDWTRVDGMDVMVAQTVVAEVGRDMTRWASEGHFASWLGLCPSKETSGGRVVKKGAKKVNNRAAAAFRTAASTLLNSNSYLGAQYRRLRAKLGAPKAITAMAHKLSRLFYRLLRYGQQYVDKGAPFYEERWRQQQLASLRRKSAQLGYALTPIHP